MQRVMAHADSVNGEHYCSPLHMLQCMCIKYSVHLGIFAVCLGETPGVAKAVLAKNIVSQHVLPSFSD